MSAVNTSVWTSKIQTWSQADQEQVKVIKNEIKKALLGHDWKVRHTDELLKVTPSSWNIFAAIKSLVITTAADEVQAKHEEIKTEARVFFVSVLEDIVSIQGSLTPERKAQYFDSLIEKTGQPLSSEELKSNCATSHNFIKKQLQQLYKLKANNQTLERIREQKTLAKAVKELPSYESEETIKLREGQLLRRHSLVDVTTTPERKISQQASEVQAVRSKCDIDQPSQESLQTFKSMQEKHKSAPSLHVTPPRDNTDDVYNDFMARSPASRRQALKDCLTHDSDMPERQEPAIEVRRETQVASALWKGLSVREKAVMIAGLNGGRPPLQWVDTAPPVFMIQQASGTQDHKGAQLAPVITNELAEKLAQRLNRSSSKEDVVENTPAEEAAQTASRPLAGVRRIAGPKGRALPTKQLTQNQIELGKNADNGL